MKRILLILLILASVIAMTTCNDYMDDITFQTGLNKGIVVYWPVMGNDTSGVEYDYAGNNDLDNGGSCSKTTGKYSTAIIIPSGGGFIRTSSFNFPTSDGITLTGWFRMYGARGFSISLSDGTDDLTLHGGPNYMTTSFNFSATGHSASVGNWNFLNIWKYFSGTYDGKTIRLFIDGNIVGSINATDSLPVFNIVTLSGDCHFDEVRIYNRALSEDEIKALMDIGME